MADANQTTDEIQPILTPVFRVSFPNVFTTAKGPDGKDTGKFSLTMLYGDDADLGELKAGASRAATKKFGANIPGNLKNPFRKGSEKPDLPGYGDDNVTFVKATSTIQPELLDRNRQPITDPRDFYAGCYARAFVVPFGYDNVGKGVSFGLRSIQKVADGEPFGAGGSMADQFDELPDDGNEGGAAPAAAPGDPLFD